MRKYNKIEVDNQEIEAIKSLIEDFEMEDQSVRQRQIREWKKLDLMWNGFTNISWDYVAHDWRVWGTDRIDDNDSNQSEYYDRNVNVFRAYLETIIAALSTTVPPVKCLPDDVDNTNDLLTARGGTHIASLIYNHIDAPLLWMRGLWIYCLQGMVAAYNYTDEDDKYGTVEIPKEEDEEIEVDQKICPVCGMVLSEEDVASSEAVTEQEEDKFDPGDEDVLMSNIAKGNKILCPTCMLEVDPELKRNKVMVTRIVGTTKQPKARQCIEVNGGLYVKVPNWARNQKDCPYVGYSFETHTSTILSKYKSLKNDGVTGESLSSESGDYQMYERWGRLSPQYRGEYPLNTPTERHWWLRPSAFESVNDEKIQKKLKKKFPAGCYAILINDTWVMACNESLDDHWTITFNSLSNAVHFNALGVTAVSIQEITQTLIDLTFQCIEHSIPITFASPKRLNFTQFANTEVKPGAVVQTLPGGGKSLSDDFLTLQTATVSPEIDNFGNKIGEMGQFTLGALPALYGGTQNASSRTASQYAMQGNRALQRLQIPWKMINFWWKDIFGKVIPAYINDMLDDERIVKPVGKESFEQIVIKKNQLEGKIGDIHLEAPEGLPQTIDQIKDTLMALIQTNNPNILAMIGDPENLPLISSIFGMDQFTIPGESDRETQFEEIQLLLNSEPLSEQEPSIMPEIFVDNHKIHAEVARAWLTSERGRQAKLEKPEGYLNNLLHLQAHMIMMNQLMQMNNPNQGGQTQAQPPKGDNTNNKLRPVSDNKES